MLKVGVVGLGSIAQKHIIALREVSPSAEVYALRHSRESKEHEGVTNIFSYEELKEVNPDFIIISNPTSHHLESILELQNSNIPLFIEKPLFNKLETLPKLKQKSYVACNLRFLDSLRFVKEYIKDRRINEVNVYCGSYLPEWRSTGNWRECYSANRAMGGGIHIDLIHEIDYIYWFFGSPSSVIKNFRSSSSLNIDSIDYANYIFNYKEFTASIILNYFRRDYKRTLEVVLEDETICVDLAKNSVTNAKGEELHKSEQTFQDTYRSQIAFFIENIGNMDNFNDICEAYEVLRICIKEDETR